MYNDIMKFWFEILSLPTKPEWSTSNSDVLDSTCFTLKRFSSNRVGMPILILPPQAGHSSCICDYDVPNQSLVHTCLTQTNNPIYAVDWKSATYRDRNNSIDDLIKFTDECVEYINDKVCLIGLCQGGWQATIYTAIYPEKVKSLINVASPIDFQAVDSKIKDMVNSFPIEYYEWLVFLGGGVMKGDFISSGFKMMNFMERFYIDYLQLYNNIDDEKYVERYRKFKNWYESPLNLSGEWYLQVVEELFKQNKLIRGKLEVLGERVNLKNITCPVVLLAGENDDITLKDQIFNISKYISSNKIKKIFVPNCGHIGIFIKEQVLRDYWPAALEYVI